MPAAHGPAWTTRNAGLRHVCVSAHIFPRLSAPNHILVMHNPAAACNLQSCSPGHPQLAVSLRDPSYARMLRLRRLVRGHSDGTAEGAGRLTTSTATPRSSGGIPPAAHQRFILDHRFRSVLWLQRESLAAAAIDMCIRQPIRCFFVCLFISGLDGN